MKQNVTNLRNTRGQFLKGKNPNRYWTESRIESEFKKAVKKTIESISEDLSSPVIPPVQYFRTHPDYKKILSAINNHKINRTSLYKKILDELGYPYPEKKSGYYAFGTVFRGWYEFCGFCFLKSWGLNVEPTIKPFETKNFINDGFLTDYQIHWEHWGELNNRNSEKLELYQSQGYKLVSTFDVEARQNNILWFYHDLKNKLLEMGVSITFIETENFNPLDLVKGKTIKLHDIYKNVKSFFGDENPKIHLMTSSLQHQVVNYFGKFSKFVEFCNKNYNESWIYQEKNYNCSDPKYCVEIMSELIKSICRFPTANEMRQNGFQCVVQSLEKHNGTESFKRNLFEDGPFVKYVIDILGEENTPYDKMYDFSKDEIFDWAVEYVKKVNSGVFPKYGRELKKLSETDKVCEYLYYSIRKNGNSKYDTWTEFQKDYFGNYESEEKQFKEVIPYSQYKFIRTQIEKNTKTNIIISLCQKNGFSITCATISRIKDNERKTFVEYSCIFEKENPNLVKGFVGKNRNGKRKYPTKKQISEIKENKESLTVHQFTTKFGLSAKTVKDIQSGLRWSF